jgi:hypothetical protein
MMHMLSAPVSSLRGCTVHTLVPDADDQCLHKFIMNMLTVHKMII